MEEIKSINESGVETIKGTVYDVNIVKTPRYSEEQKEILRQELEVAIKKKEEYATIEAELRVIIDKFK